MSVFKLKIRYSGTIQEEIVNTEAKNLSAARNFCLEMMEKSKDEKDRLERLNVYVSRMKESCEVCRDWRQELEGCSF